MHESVDKHIIIQMLQKLLDKGKLLKFEDKNGKLHTINSFYYGKPGEQTLQIVLSTMHRPSSLIRTWENDALEMLSLKKLDDNTWALFEKPYIPESADEPIFLWAFRRIVASGKKVMVLDEVLDEEPMELIGYEISEKGIRFTLKQKDVGEREIIYDRDFLTGEGEHSFKVEKTEDGWLITVT